LLFLRAPSLSGPDGLAGFSKQNIKTEDAGTEESVSLLQILSLSG